MSELHFNNEWRPLIRCIFCNKSCCNIKKEIIFVKYTNGHSYVKKKTPVIHVLIHE